MSRSCPLTDDSGAIRLEIFGTSGGGALDLIMCGGEKIRHVDMCREREVIQRNVSARSVFGNVRARAKPFAFMFGVRSASVALPTAARPKVGDLQNRGQLFGAGGENGKKGENGKNVQNGKNGGNSGGFVCPQRWSFLVLLLTHRVWFEGGALVVFGVSCDPSLLV